MNRYFLAVLIHLVLTEVTLAQSHDRFWATGGVAQLIEFKGDTEFYSYPENINLQLYSTVPCISNKEGDFQFLTNGVTILNREGLVMKNGDSLNYPAIYFDILYSNGLSNTQGAVILPKPGSDYEYFIFHNAVDTELNNGGYMPLNLYYTTVDMRLDSGRGAVPVGKKNIPLVEDVRLSWGRMAACKHANGRDWWLIKPVWHKGTYYRFLVTPDGIQGPEIQTIGPDYGYTVVGTNEQVCKAIFSQDGTRFASSNYGFSVVVLMDFDRCTGLFSNPKSIYNYDLSGFKTVPLNVNVLGAGGLAFSPSGRFLYVNRRLGLNQYDLETTKSQDSIRIATFTDSCYFCDYEGVNHMQLAPNGKLYVSTFSGGSYAMHVIDYPDKLGLACGFRRYGQPVNNPNATIIPYFPNYRLGAGTASGCDTIRTAAPPSLPEGEQPIQVYPNPASSVLMVVLKEKPTGNTSVFVTDVLGTIVLQQSLSQQRTSLDIRTLATGLYFVRVDNMVVKFLKE